MRFSIRREMLEMSESLFHYQIRTSEKQQFLMVDEYLKDALAKSKVQEGLMLVYCPHTTAAITINENADPDVRHDLKTGMDAVFPNRTDYVHAEGNSDGHMKSSNIGASELLIINKGQLILGTWQSVYFCEFDGPRSRHFYVKILEG